VFAHTSAGSRRFDRKTPYDLKITYESALPQAAGNAVGIRLIPICSLHRGSRPELHGRTASSALLTLPTPLRVAGSSYIMTVPGNGKSAATDPPDGRPEFPPRVRDADPRRSAVRRS